MDSSGAIKYVSYTGQEQDQIMLEHTLSTP
jgi:hypothetical protein